MEQAVLDRSRVASEEWEGVLAARAGLIARFDGELLLDLYHAARAVLAEPGVRDWGSAGRHKYAATVIAWALRWSVGYARQQLDLAEELVEELPMVLAELLAGRIDAARAAAFVAVLRHLDDRDLAREIATGRLVKARTWTVAQLRESLRYHVDRRDPQGARRRHQAKVCERGVSLSDDHDGVASVTIYHLPAPRAAAIVDRLDRLAKAARTAGDPRRLHQLRADAACDLIEGIPFQVIPTRDPLTADADAAYPTGPLDDNDDDGPPPPPMPDPDREIGFFDYEASLTSEADHAWLHTQLDLQTSEPQSRLPTGNPNHDSAGRFADLRVLPADRCHCGGRLPPQPPGAVNLTVKLTTLAGLDEHPGLLARLSSVTADIARHIALNPTNPAMWRWSLRDDTGRLLHHGTTNHRPDTATATPSQSHTGNRLDKRPGQRLGERECTCPRVQPTHRRNIVDLQLTQATLDDPPPGWANVIADITTQLATQDPPAKWSTVDKTGNLKDHGHTGRHFNHTEAAFIRARDRTCRTPGCRHPSRTCDLDHITQHSHGGPSHRGNGQPLCPHHHHLRDTPGVSVTTNPDGSTTWTLPNGNTHHVSADKDIVLTHDDTSDAGGAAEQPLREDGPHGKASH